MLILHDSVCRPKINLGAHAGMPQKSWTSRAIAESRICSWEYFYLVSSQGGSMGRLVNGQVPRGTGSQ